MVIAQGHFHTWCDLACIKYVPRARVCKAGCCWCGWLPRVALRVKGKNIGGKVQNRGMTK